MKSGKLNAVAVASDRVLPGLEGIPLAKDTVRDLNVYGWFVVIAPKGTPAPVLQRLNAEINRAIGLPDVIARFHDLGTYPMPGSLADAQKFVKSEKALFGRVLREAAITAE